MSNALKTFAKWTTALATIAIAGFCILYYLWDWSDVWSTAAISVPLIVTPIMLYLEYFNSPKPFGRPEMKQRMEEATQIRLVRFFSAASVLIALITGFLHQPWISDMIALVLFLLYKNPFSEEQSQRPFRWSLPVFLILPTMIAFIFSDAMHGGSTRPGSFLLLFCAGGITWLVGHMLQKHNSKTASQVQRPEMRRRARRSF
jgi:hypothetical protein